MKKKFLSLLLSCVTAASLFSFAGCGENYVLGERNPVDENETVYTVKSEEKYKNFIDFFDGDGDVYDIGDPYIFRYDGKFYLYSSLNGEKRFQGIIPCWVSENLVDWEWAGWAYGKGNKENPETTIACAPEVIFYQGWFYLIESQTGEGHYIFRSKNPNGPFERVSENLGGKIDGTFYLADDGELYMASATLTGIAYRKVKITEKSGTAEVSFGEPKSLESATLSNAWTEGPGYFTRNGYSYVTFTGNHVDSASYRVGYSYTTSDFIYDNLNNLYNNVTLVSTGEDTDPINVGYNGNAISALERFSNYRGTGHSTNTYGPNLDSVYTAYHNAKRINYNNIQEGSARRYNLTRYYTNGGYLTADSLANFWVNKPQNPDYYATADKLIAGDGVLLSDKETAEVFTAELNFKTTDGKAEAYIGYVDQSNYVKFTVYNDFLSVIKVTNGKQKLLANVNVTTGSNLDAVHVIKAVCGTDRAEFYFDNMKKAAADIKIGKGKIGYGESTAASVTVFTDDAFGTSDFDAVKNLTGTFPAYAYVKGENKGWQIKDATEKKNGVRQGEKDSTILTDNGYAVELKAGDWVKYNVNAPIQDWYDLSALVSADSKGAIVEVIIDNEHIFRMDVDETSFGTAEYMNMSLGKFFIDKGEHTLKIRVYSGTLKVKQFSTEKNAGGYGEVTETLTSKPEDVKTLIGYSYYDTDGMCVNEYIDRTMTYWGSRGMTDYEFSVDVNLPIKTLLQGNFGGGFLFRAKNYHYAANSKVPANNFGWQGYFLSVTNSGLLLYKCNFNSKQLGSVDLEGGKTFFGMGEKSINIKIRAYHSELTVYVNGEKVISFVDAEEPFTSGYIGFYGVGGHMLLKNFRYSEI